MALAKTNFEISGPDLETITELAAEAYGPRDIAFALRKDIRSFMHVWKDKNSQVREAYELGIMEIERDKRQKLNQKITTGSITAIQMHDKRAEEQRFEDIKREVFSFD